ncbi:MAG TPA: DinB family protein [Anaerolineae bacterium]|nr:DinB family protein [Anaerolineae bacterium]
MPDTFAALDACFDQPAAFLTYRPAGGWSSAEILEHVSLTNHYLLKIIRKGVVKARRRAETRPIPPGESDLTPLAAIGHPDAFPWHRPDHMAPTGATPLPEIRARLRHQQQDCLELLDSMPNGAGALYTVRMSVQDLGKLDMYQWLYFLALHAQRHLVEMERLAATYFKI